MAKFLAVYIGTATDDEKAQPLDRTVEQAGMTAWGRWMEENAGAILDQGGPLGHTKAIDRGGIRDSRNQMTAYLILEADSLEEAAARFRNHPHFTIFPGDRVEVVECLEMPAA